MKMKTLKGEKYLIIVFASVVIAFVNADANAGFNIAYLYQNGISQFCKERDLQNGSTDTPEKAMLVKPQQL